MYFVSYTTNKLELPQYGWNVWKVKENKRLSGNPRSIKILKILIGGKKRDVNNMIVNDKHIADNEREVIEVIFNL